MRTCVAPADEPEFQTHAFAPHCHRLCAGDRAHVLRHFQALDDEDVALRFGTSLSAAAIDRYVDAIDFDADIVLGFRDAESRVLGIVQLLRLSADHQSCAELAFSVIPLARGRGLAGRLMAGAVESARAQGIARLLVQVCPRNAPMLAVLRHAGMQLTPEGGEIVGVLSLCSEARYASALVPPPPGREQGARSVPTASRAIASQRGTNAGRLS